MQLRFEKNYADELTSRQRHEAIEALKQEKEDLS
jgi:hypothetical protein